MKRTWIASSLAVGVLTSAGAAHAEGYLIVNGGLLVPIGDDDWENVVESSPTLAVRGGGGRRTAGNGRVSLEGSFEFSPLSTSVNGGVLDVSLTQYRALLGVRFELPISRGAFFSLRGGLGIDHLRLETSSPLLPGVTNTDTDTGLALELGAGPWFAVGPVQVGVELALPMGFHTNDNQDGNGVTIDFKNIDLSFLGGVRFRL